MAVATRRYHSRISLALLILAATTAQAATWIVNADGSGDVPTIQDALDAASSGDRILLGAGVFDSYGPDPQWPERHLYLMVETDGLCIEGAGRELSVIGQVDGANHVPTVTVLQVAPGVSLEIRDLTLQLGDQTDSRLVAMVASNLVATNCAFRGAATGIVNHGGTGFVVSESEFSQITNHAISLGLGGPGTIQGTNFHDVGLGVFTMGSYVRMADCEFIGNPEDPNSLGANVAEMSAAAFRRCTFRDHGRAGILMEAGTVDLNDCHIGAGSAVGLDIYDALLRGAGNVVTGNQAAVLLHRRIETQDFHQNHIVSGGGWTVQTGTYFYGSGGDVDLSYNWWGTDDLAAIAATILDHEDDPDIPLTVSFTPFLDAPAATEVWSLTRIKALFR